MTWPKIRRARRHLKVPVSTLKVSADTPQVPIGTPQVPIDMQINRGSITLFCVFGHFTSLFWLYFSLKKIWLSNKVSQNLHGLLN